MISTPPAEPDPGAPIPAPEPRISTLDNGIRIVGEENPGLAGFTLGIWIGMGSVDERPGTGGRDPEYGGMHFLEHVLFKGTETYGAFEISALMDAAGAELNAFTAKEHTCFHVQAPAVEFAVALDVLASVVAEGLCEDEAVEIERGVIADEIAGRDDDPEDLAAETGYELALPEHPLGRSVLGSAEDLAALTPSALRELHARALDPAKIVVSAVGPVPHERIVDRLASGPLARLAPRAGEDTYSESAFESRRLLPARGSLEAIRMSGQQSHVGMSVLTPGRDDRRRAAAHVAAAALGAGVSSRLFQGIRERYGVGYNVDAGIEQYGPAGILHVSASAPTPRSAHLLTAVGEEIEAFAVTPPDAEELWRASGYLKGSIVLGRDDPMARMARMGRHLLERGRIVSVTDSLARLEAVTPEQVAEAWELITGEGWHTVLLGPGRVGAQRRSAPILARLSGARGRAR
ncbi:M16 family metallopeptidase [Dietzia sp.]|uniref:M16 family metallopeptidase n=1 Tax=Dietzia sp. TaxID=1871616 RepID=UPI002FD9E1BF